MYTLQGKTWPTRHVRFPRQPMYARCTLPVGGPRTWQPFTSHQQSWAGPLLSKKKAPDTIHSKPTDRSVSPYPVSLYRWQVTRLTGPISPACDRYVQYLLVRANPLVLNRHRQGLQPWMCRLSTYYFSTFPTSCLPFPPKGPSRSQVINPSHYHLNWRKIMP
jgi:hypothetical protein